MTTAARACAACQTPLPEDALFCLRCGTATPTDPGVPPRTGTTELGEIARVRKALAEHYQVERILGEGGMATVYLAQDLKHRRKVAVKVMHPDMAATLGAERFLREVEIAAQLTHPHILPVYDSGTVGDILYYVMPNVEGESLLDRLQRETELPIEDAVRIAREVAEALAYAHARNIVHRDIKPANIMMSTGHALVADFGIARAAGAVGAAAITKTGLAVGTPQYMSPEQANGSPNVDQRADIFALGCVFYEMVAGEPPFTGPTPQAIVIRSMTETPRSLSTTREGLSAALDAVVLRALAKSPADRWQTAQQFADALGRAMDTLRSGERVAAVAPETGPSPARVWGLFGFAALVTLGVLYGLVSRWGLPVWVLYLAMGLLAIGALVLTLTGRMEARRRVGVATPGLGRLFTWRNATLGGVLAMGSWALVVTALIIKGPGGDGSGGVRLAVLPFENRGAPEEGYIVDGITDQVRGKLVALPGFQITARTSSDQYRGSRKSPQDIGKELGVDYLLTSTVTWIKLGAGKGRLSVVPELINVKTGAGTWQQSFDADITDVFEVQGTIATKVAGALGVALGAKEQEQLAERPTKNLAAYDIFLKGKALTSNDPATLRQAAGFYEQAVALDSTFTEAWALLSGVLSNIYFNSTPDPNIGNRARIAAERARVLEPDGSLVHYAMARYQYLVANDVASAATEANLALRIAPNDVNILRQSATLEQSLGQWDDALAHLQKARQLDPRAVRVGITLQGALTVKRRYGDALELGNEILAMAPADLQMIESQAITHLMQGDLAGARSVIKSAPPTLAQTAIVAYFGNYNDLYWVLDEEQQQLLLRLTPSAYDGDRAVWADVIMQTLWLRGDKIRARAYADSSLAELTEQLKKVPNDPQRNLFSGLAHAYLGHKAEAIRFGERGLELAPLSRDQNNGAYGQHQLIRIYLVLGENEKALDLLEPLVKVPYLLSPGYLRIDPGFAPLKGNPRFEKLLKGTA